MLIDQRMFFRLCGVKLGEVSNIFVKDSARQSWMSLIDKTLTLVEPIVKDKVTQGETEL